MSILSKKYIDDKTVASVKEYGAVGDGTTDDSVAVQLAASSVDDLFYSPGTYLINSNITLGAAGKVHHFHVGAIIKPASGVTVIIEGNINADYHQIFDVSAGGIIAITDTHEIQAKWFGATGDGTTNDYLVIQAAINALPTGGIVQLGEGTFHITHQLVMADAVTLRGLGAGKTLIKSTIVVSGFDSNPITRLPNALASGTLSGDVVVGSITADMNITPAPVAGDFVGFVHNDSGVTYVAQSVTGSGPYTVTLDRPIVIPFADGEAAYLLDSYPRDISVEDLDISGSGGHAILFANCLRPRISRVRCIGTYGLPSSAGFGFDACNEPLIEDCYAEMTGTYGAPCFYMETAERGVMRRCVAKDGYFGFQLSDCFLSSMEYCWGYDQVVFCHELGSLLAEGVNFGCYGCTILGGGANNVPNALDINGSRDGTVIGYAAKNCSAQGLLLAKYGSVEVRDNKFIGCSFLDCGNAGVLIQGDVVSTHFESLDVSDCGTYGFHSKSDVTVRGLVARGFSDGVPIFIEQGTARISDAIIEQTTTVNSAVIVSGDLTEIDGAEITIGSSIFAFTITSGLTRLSRIKILGGAGGGIDAQPGAALQVLNCDFSGLDIGIQFASGTGDSSIDGLDISGCSTNGLLSNCLNHLSLSRITATDYTTGDPITINFGTVDLNDSVVSCIKDGIAFVTLTGTRNIVNNLRVSGTGTTGSLCLGASGETIISNSSFELTGPGVGVQLVGNKNILKDSTISCTGNVTAYAYQQTDGDGVLENVNITSDGRCIITSAGTILRIDGGTFAGAGSISVDLAGNTTIIDGYARFDFTGSPADASCMVLTNGISTIRNIFAIGPNDTIGIEIANGAILKLGPGVLLENFGQNILVDSGGLLTNEIGSRIVYVEPFGAIGNDLTDNLAALQDALAVSDELVYTRGIYKISTGTIGTSANQTHKFSRGSYLKPTGNIIISGQIIAEPNQQIFDLTGGGTISLPNMDLVYVAWFGAKGDRTVDDAIGITAACNAIGINGGTIKFHRAEDGYYDIRSTIEIGTDGQSTQGIRWEFEDNSYNTYRFQCTSSLGAGKPMVRITSCIRAELGNVTLDAGGLADFCLQRVAPIIGPNAAIPGWHTRLDQVVMRNANIANHLVGDIHLRATVSGSTFTAIGHELSNNDEMYFLPFLRSTVLPTGAIRDQIYHVVNSSGNTFKLSLTEGGSPETFSDSGEGPWLLARKDEGDCTISLGMGVQYGNINTECNLLAHIIQASDNTFEATEHASFFQGNMQGSSNFTSDKTANTITTAHLVFDGGNVRAPIVGDVFLVSPADPNGGDALPGGLTTDTEYWVKTVTPAGGGNYTLTLALTQNGSAIDITSDMTGTCNCLALASPYHGIYWELGTINVDKCVAAALYNDIFIRPRPSSTGFAGRIALHSESWRILDCDTSDITLTCQIGSVDLDGCSHFNIFTGYMSSIRWIAPLFNSLNIKGGSFNGDLLTGTAIGSTSPVTLMGPIFWSSFRTPGVIDSVGSVRGNWFQNGVPVSRIVGAELTFVYQPTSAHVTSNAISILVASGAGQITSELAGISILAPSGSNTYAQIKCPGGGGELGIFFDADTINFRDSGSAQRGTITFPSGNINFTAVSGLTLDSGTSITIKSNGHTQLSGNASGHGALGSTTPTIPFGASVTGSRSGGTALSNLLSILAQLGAITDSTSA